MKAVVIGNGPSLNEHLKRGDMDLLLDREIDTFGCNEIHRIYPRTVWRPTHWVWVENMKDNKWEWAFVEHVLPSKEICYIRSDLQRELLHDKYKKEKLEKIFYGNRMFAERDQTDLWTNPSKKLYWVERCSWKHYNEAPEDWHLPIFCTYGGVMSTVLPLAFMLGYKDVAVIGCDLGTKLGGGDHFAPDYKTDPDYDISLNDDRLIWAHILAKRNYEKNGRRIVNAGIGGELDVYPRMDLREWIDD